MRYGRYADTTSEPFTAPLLTVSRQHPGEGMFTIDGYSKPLAAAELASCVIDPRATTRLRRPPSF